MKQSRLSRVVNILTTLQANHDYAVDDLAALFGTSRRTVFRDLKELETVGVPYTYDPQSGGYRIDPEFFLPPIDLTLQEALSILLLGHKVRNQVQLPFKNSALLGMLKIENNLPAKLRKYCSTMLSRVSVKAAAQAPHGLLDKHFAHLQKAIADKKTIMLTYHSLYDHGDIQSVIHPYHLLHNHRAWYVLGFSHHHNSIRTFKLNRIKALIVQDKCYLDGDSFDIDAHLGRAWSMIPEGVLYNIKLLFSPKVAANVAEVQWHSTQKTSMLPDGAAEVEFRVDGLNEIMWWILGYGDQVTVLAPAALRKKIAAVARNMLARYETPQAVPASVPI